MDEYTRARAWRESLGLTQQALGHAVGYSRESIVWFERGQTPPSRGKAAGTIAPWIWQRYKMACAGYAAERAGKPFHWQVLS